MNTTNINLIEIEHLHDLCKKILDSNDSIFIEEKILWLVEFHRILNFNLGYEHLLWRARKVTSKDGYANINQLSYPPRNLTKPGRLNSQGEPMYYASFTQQTTLEEIEASEGDIIHMTGSEITNPIRGCIVGEFVNIHRSGKGIMVNDIATSMIKKTMENLSQDPKAIASFIYIDAFFSSVLRDKNAQNNNYIHSRALGKAILSSIKDAACIFYPSVALEGSMNVAIQPEFVMKSTEIKINCLLKINKKYSYGIYDFEILKIAKGHDKNGTIIWQ